MSDMQDKILTAVTARIEAHEGVEAVRKGKYANTGTIYAQPREGFEHLVSIDYDFQDASFDLHLWGEAVTRVHDEAAARGVATPLRYSSAGSMSGACCTSEARQHPAMWFPARYTEADRITLALDTIDRVIVEAWG